MSAPNLPPSAIERLQNAQAGIGCFTGELTPRDLLVLGQCGFKASGLAMGICVMSLGGGQFGVNQFGGGQFGGYMMNLAEIQYLVDGYGSGFYNALGRLEAEANALGADGVIGIDLKFESFGEGILKVTAIGTAIKHQDRSDLKNLREMPFSTTLSAAEFSSLYRQGYCPSGMCFGYANWPSGYRVSIGFQSGEEPYLTQSIYVARNLATTRAIQYAESHGASGIVSVNLDVGRFTPDPQSGFFWVTATFTGTAIKQISPPTLNLKTSVAISLADRRLPK